MIFALSVTSCKKEVEKEEKGDGKLNVVTTTSMITDIVKNVGGDLVHLEGLMGFEKMDSSRKKQVALGKTLDESTLIGSDYFASNYDPHVWFNIEYFKQFVEKV